MLPDKAKFVMCSIISLVLSFWMRHLVIGQLQKPAKFSAFHWSTSRTLVCFWNQQNLPKQGSTFTETNRNGLIHHIGCLITQSDCNGPILDLVYPILLTFLTKFQPILANLITESDKAVRAMHSCKSGYLYSLESPR